MTHFIPFDIQTEIIQRIPDTKTVIRYRSVSKTWKSVIDSKEFVAAHTLHHTHHGQANRHHLLIRTQDCSDCKHCTHNSRCGVGNCYDYTPAKYYSIVDDDETFPHQKVSVFVPDSVHKFGSDGEIIGTSLGLFCLYEYGDTAVIWNPSIRKAVAIPVPDVLPEQDYVFFGFGVCPQNLDPKLVKITCVYDSSRLQDVNASAQVEVSTLSSGGTWRSPLSSNLPRMSIYFRSQAVVDRFIYWSGYETIVMDDGTRNPQLIMSFDLTTEEFTKVKLPDPLQLNQEALIGVSYLRESLAVIGLHGKIYNVWMMIGHGCTRSFNKLYSINRPEASIRRTLGLRKSGAFIFEVDNDKEDHCRYERALALYGPESKSSTKLGIYGFTRNFFVHSCMETLLLHGH